jgi:N-acetylglucosaminyldiphosphoundecaprenol N-acetyl-beta-D-mannosaminyltransferase
MTKYISGLPVATESFEDILQDMDTRIRENSVGNYISITNTESMYHAMRNSDHHDYVVESDYSLCDGIGVVIAGYAWGVKVPRRNGPILMLKACEYGLSKDWKHYFYGGKEGVPDLLEAKLKDQFPNLNIVGKYSPPFRSLTDEEKQWVIEDIKNSGADIVWVGLGLVKQEAWIAEYINLVNAPWMVGVGAAFDYHAGTVPWAPKWIQAIGMEWLYRTIIQPKLRIQRYIWSFQFMFESIWDGIKNRFSLNSR